MAARKAQDDPRRQLARRIARGLAKQYPDAHCALDYETPLQLLIATILSAQCTDVRVNLVTPALFARYPDARAFAAADVNALETAIQSTGFFRNKARSIIACCQALVRDHNGQVPSTMEELVPLAGIGRKTANVILGNAFGVPGITVDTHVTRLSNRMGLTKETDAQKIERDLMELIPKKDWTMFSHGMIWHGRQVCQARQPSCSTCTLTEFCPKIGVNDTV
jgi:endonuclease-3